VNIGTPRNFVFWDKPLSLNDMI